MWGLEERVLMRCVRRDLGAEHAAELTELVHQGLDWERVLRMAASHGVSAFLNRHLIGLAPEPVQAELKSRARRTAINELRLLRELIQVIEKLREAGIGVLPFKGPVLAALLYGETGLREFSDLDILVRKGDFQRAMEVLRRLGYASPLTNGVRRFEVGNSERLVVRQETGAAVDLHWELAKKRFVGAVAWEGVWDRSGSVVIGGKEVPTLSNEDLLHYLCVHGSKHLWTKLAWICDVAELLRARPRMDCDVLMERARRAGTRRMLLLGLLLAHELLEAPVRAGVLEAAKKDPALRLLATEVRNGMCDEGRQASGPFRNSVFMLRASERWRDRTRHVFMILGSPSCVLHGLRSLAARGI